MLCGHNATHWLTAQRYTKYASVYDHLPAHFFRYAASYEQRICPPPRRYTNGYQQ
jgi:hypothetical protein